MPYTEFGFGIPDYSARFSLFSDIKSQGSRGYCDLGWMHDFGRVRIRADVYRRFDALHRIRGYLPEYLLLATGSVYSFDFTYLLAELRAGFWNPNIAVGDLFGNLFVDYSTLSSGKHTYGYEVQAEVYSCYWASAVSTLGIASVSGGWSGYFGASLTF